METMDIREKLISIRESKGYSKRTVSEMTGIPYTTYIKYESGERKEVSMQALCKLADFYGVTTDYLLGREPAPPNPFENLRLTKEQEEDANAKYQMLTPQDKAIVASIIRAFAEAHRNGEKPSTMTYCGTIGEELQRRQQEENALRKDTA